MIRIPRYATAASFAVVLLTNTYTEPPLYAQSRAATAKLHATIDRSVLRVGGLHFPHVAASNKTSSDACCAPGDTRNVDNVATIDLSSPKGMAKKKYVPATGYAESVYSPPLSCWVISSYRRQLNSANDPYEATTDAQPPGFQYVTTTEFTSTLETMNNYVGHLNIADTYKADLKAKLESFVKSYSSYANNIRTSHSQVRHRARVQGRGAFNGRSWYKAAVNTSEICCPREVRDAAALEATLKEWVDQVVADSGLLSTATSYTGSFISSAGRYVTAEGGGGSSVTCNRTAKGTWETFEIVDKNGGSLTSGDEINIRASNGMYVVAEGGGGGAVNANRQVPSVWETFTILKRGGADGVIVSGDSIALRSIGGRFVTAEGGGGGAVVCDRTAAHEWETFRFITP